VDQLFIVVAPVPHVPLPTIDQLLAAGEAYGMAPMLLLNKCDLPAAQELKRQLKFYSDNLGYPLLCVSATTGEGLASVRHALRDGEASIFIGQSGVCYHFISINSPIVFSSTLLKCI
jgi:ribosome biogenesis GTPase